ncbi:MAG TPA: long-chain fatty acid--CoA ligase [Terriglobales bacterium]|nr:long-chain fatty acid--CoA ligase [Terriglobales bacterium]
MKSTMMDDFLLTLPVLLERTAKLFSKVEIVSRRPDHSLHRYTYGDFYRRARALAEQLQRAGIQPGDRVATLMRNHYAHLEAYFGIPCCAGIAHTLNFRLHPDELAYIINHAEDQFLILDQDLLPLFEKIRNKVNIKRVLVFAYGEPACADYASYEEFLAGASGRFEYPRIDESAAAAMAYTSGTTGKPKGVLYSHRSIVLHSLILALTDGLSLSQSDVMMPLQPMFHANAWGYPHAAVMLGAKLVLPGSHVDADSIIELLASEQVTISGGVPTVWTDVAEKLEADPQPGKFAPRLRFICAGSAPSEALMRRLAAHGMRTIHGWGMTETSPFAVLNRRKSYMPALSADEGYAFNCRHGYALPLVQVRAVNEGAEIPWDGKSMGELEIRGPWIAESYYNCPEQAGRWTEDGWFRTGDVVTVDEEGYVRLTDRVKDLVKSGGEWISSVDVENALVAHPAVREAAVIGVPHPRWVERPIAILVVQDGASVSPEALRTFLLERFSKWQVPDAFIFADELPHTSVGKLLKSELRQRYRDWNWSQTAQA